MQSRAWLLAAMLALAGCSKITQENFAQIRDGMSEQEVQALRVSARPGGSLGRRFGA